MAYALLLLNTDLHGVQEHHQKMKKARFVKNTMETIISLVFPSIMDSTKPMHPPTHKGLRRPSIDTSTLSRNTSLGGRRQIRKTKSYHNIAPFSLKRSSFWHGGDDNDDRNTMISEDGAPLCQAMKDTTATKSQSLVDLPYYLKAISDGTTRTRDERRWLANLEQLLKVSTPYSPWHIGLFTCAFIFLLLRICTPPSNQEKSLDLSLQGPGTCLWK